MTASPQAAVTKPQKTFTLALFSFLTTAGAGTGMRALETGATSFGPEEIHRTTTFAAFAGAMGGIGFVSLVVLSPLVLRMLETKVLRRDTLNRLKGFIWGGLGCLGLAFFAFLPPFTLTLALGGNPLIAIISGTFGLIGGGSGLAIAFTFYD